MRQHVDSLLGFAKAPAKVIPLEIGQTRCKQLSVSLNILVIGPQESKGFFQSQYSNKAAR